VWRCRQVELWLFVCSSVLVSRVWRPSWTKKVGSRMRQGWIRVALPFVLRVKRSRSVSCVSCSACGDGLFRWMMSLAVSCAAGKGCRCLSFAACVSEQLPVAVVGRSVGRACAVCSVRTSSTTHDRAHGAEAMMGWQSRSEQMPERRGRHALAVHTDNIHDSHDDTAKGLVGRMSEGSLR